MKSKSVIKRKAMSVSLMMLVIPSTSLKGFGTKPLSRRKRRQRNGDLLNSKDDFATPLSQLTDKLFFRPVPPDHLLARLGISKGNVVDAYYKDWWWRGLVIKEIEDDKSLVFFDSPPDIIQFEKKHLRPHLDWVNRKKWILSNSNIWLLRRLTEESIFSSGTMVEVSSKINNTEIVWIPAMVIKEIEVGDDEKEDNEKKDDEKKYIVKFCNNNKSLSCKGTKANLVTVDLRNVRPTPPPFLVEEYKPLDCVEAFRGSKWRKGIMKRVISRNQYIVSFKATEKQLKFNHSDLRPPMEWEDGVWKKKESPLAQGSGNRMADFVMNGNSPSLANESVSPVTPSRVVPATPLQKTEAETQRKKQNGLANDSTQENESSSEDNNRKRKREENLTSATNVIEETTEANDTTLVMPFVKKLPVWKTFESMEAFKTIPQCPHFRPLIDTSENSREVSAVGLMFTFSGLIEEIKNLRLSNSISTLVSISKSFTELEKHGFDVKAPQSRILNLISLKGKQAKKTQELKVSEKETRESEQKS